MDEKRLLDRKSNGRDHHRMEAGRQRTVPNGVARVVWLVVLSLAIVFFFFVMVGASFVSQFDADIPSDDPTKVIASGVALFAGLVAVCLFVFLIAEVRRESVLTQRYGILLATLLAVGVADWLYSWLRFDSDVDLASDLGMLGLLVVLFGGLAATVRNSVRLARGVGAAGGGLLVAGLLSAALG